jgi:hypothetical protein
VRPPSGLPPPPDHLLLLALYWRPDAPLSPGALEAECERLFAPRGARGRAGRLADLERLWGPDGLLRLPADFRRAVILPGRGGASIAVPSAAVAALLRAEGRARAELGVAGVTVDWVGRGSLASRRAVFRAPAPVDPRLPARVEKFVARELAAFEVFEPR